MNTNRGLSYPNPGWTGDGAGISLTRNPPDPAALAIPRQMQELLKPAEIIVPGSRATGDHCHDSDVDLMAADEAGVQAAECL